MRSAVVRQQLVALHQNECYAQRTHVPCKLLAGRQLTPERQVEHGDAITSVYAASRAASAWRSTAVSSRPPWLAPCSAGATAKCVMCSVGPCSCRVSDNYL
jgi:hypothetical protein